jgi:hypothetical protein
MRIFMTGATGFVGTEVAHELINSGHKVLGLARSKEAAAALAAIGADAHSGSLENLDSLRSGADASDAVIHLGFNTDYSKFRENCAIEQRAIEAIGSAIIGSGKPLIVPNGMAGSDLLKVAGKAGFTDSERPGCDLRGHWGSPLTDVPLIDDGTSTGRTGVLLMPFRTRTAHILQFGLVRVEQRGPQPAPPPSGRVEAAHRGRRRKQHSRDIRI